MTTTASTPSGTPRPGPTRRTKPKNVAVILRSAIDNHFLFDLSVDPDEQENRSNEAVATEKAELLRSALVSLEAPGDRFERQALSW